MTREHPHCNKSDPKHKKKYLYTTTRLAPSGPIASASPPLRPYRARLRLDPDKARDSGGVWGAMALLRSVACRACGDRISPIWRISRCARLAALDLPQESIPLEIFLAETGVCCSATHPPDFFHIRDGSRSLHRDTVTPKHPPGGVAIVWRKGYPTSVAGVMDAAFRCIPPTGVSHGLWHQPGSGHRFVPPC